MQNAECRMKRSEQAYLGQAYWGPLLRSRSAKTQAPSTQLVHLQSVSVGYTSKDWKAPGRHRQSSEWSRPQTGLVQRMHCDLQSGSTRFDIMHEVAIVFMGTWGISLRRDAADAV